MKLRLVARGMTRITGSTTTLLPTGGLGKTESGSAPPATPVKRVIRSLIAAVGRIM